MEYSYNVIIALLIIAILYKTHMIEKTVQDTETTKWYDNSPWHDVKEKLGEQFDSWDEPGGNIDFIQNSINEITQDPLLQTLTFHLVGYRVLDGDEGHEEITKNVLKEIIVQERLQAEAPIGILNALGITRDLSNEEMNTLHEKNKQIQRIKDTIKDEKGLIKALGIVHNEDYEKIGRGISLDKKSYNILAKAGIIMLLSVVLSNTRAVSANDIPDTVYIDQSSSFHIPSEKKIPLEKQSMDIRASANYNIIKENVTDPRVVENMRYSMDLINEYMNTHTLKPINMKEDERLKDLVERATADFKIWNRKGLRYIDAMNYFAKEDKWVQPLQGIEGGGSCDIATVIKRAITRNFEQIGETESWFGHTVQRWGPFVIVFYEHDPYPKMAEDMIAVSSIGEKKEMRGYNNTEFMVFLVNDSITPINNDVSIRIVEYENNFFAVLSTATDQGSRRNNDINHIDRIPY